PMAEPSRQIQFTTQDGIVRSNEMCNGSGVCRKIKGGTMCPSYLATKDEKDSTRGRANALRLALAPLSEDRGSRIEDRASSIEDRGILRRDSFRLCIIYSPSSSRLRSQSLSD